MKCEYVLLGAEWGSIQGLCMDLEAKAGSRPFDQMDGAAGFNVLVAWGGFAYMVRKRNLLSYRQEVGELPTCV